MNSSSLYAALLLVATLASSLAASIVWQRRHSPGAWPLLGFLASLFVWSLTYAIYWLTPAANAGARIFWLDATYLGVVWAPTAFLFFTLHYTHRERWATHRLALLLAIEPLLTLLLLWTDPLHGIFFAGLRTPDSSTIFAGGPWFWIHIVYSYGMLLIIYGLLVQHYRRARDQFRRQAGTILFAVTLPWLSNIISLIDLNPLHGLDLTPLTFTLTGVILTYALFYQRLLDLIPVARDRVVERMLEPVFVLDAQQRIIDLNPAASRLLERMKPEAASQALGAALSTFFPDWTQWIASENGLHEITMEGDGRRLYYEPLISPLHDERGQQQGQILILNDITRHKQAQEALKQSEEKYARAFQTSPYAMTLARVRDGAFVEVNEAFTTLSGYNREEALNHSSLELGLWVDLQARDQIYQDLSAGQRVFNRELQFRHRSGKIVTGLLSAQMLTLNDEQYILSSIADISERKQVEEALQESEARQRALLRAVPDLILRQHRDGTYLDYHVGDPSLLAAPPEQFLGRNIREIFSPEETERFIGWNEEAVTTGREVIREYELKIGDELRHFEARIVASGPDEVVTLIRDITELKQARQREFEIALEKERARVLTTFMQHASHEFRTPLTIINSSTSLIALHEDPQTRQQKATRIREQVKRITTLVDMILQMVRLESGTHPMGLVHVDELLRRSAHMMQERNPKRKIIVQVEPDLPVVRGNERLLHQALEALIDNALRFSPEQSAVTISAACAEDAVVLTVQDEGPGIPEEEQALIFETFWRKDAAHTTPGFGLGLALARRIAGLHNGALSVESQVGQGSRFHLRLPSA